MRTGVLGGTFDPVHNGHLAIAEAAREAARLAGVLFVPAPRPWQKARRDLAPAADRVAMLEMAVKGKPHFRISRVDLERAGPSYTIDTIIDLRKQATETDELFFILGWDSLVNLPFWKAAGRLVGLCYLIAAPRPGYPRPDLAALESELPRISSRVTMMDGPCLDISASEIRERAARGLPVDHLVPPAVAAYIEARGLYRKMEEHAEGGI